MNDMLAFDAPKNQNSIIKVLGVGGGGSNAVNHMYKQGIKGVDFIICNTDAQAMEISTIPNKIQLGSKGLGAGSIPSVGKEAAEENIQDIKDFLEKNTKMLFVTAGMGGGTGTGAAPVIARVAKEIGILTVGIVTIPFSFEGRKRRLQAENGIEELRKHVDTLLIISNDKLREIHGNMKLTEAFGQADNILTTAAKGIAEIITVTGYINVDFEDVKTVMQNSGTAIMGSAEAEGENRAAEAVQSALSSPLLNDNKIDGANNILLYITSGKEEITFDEVTEITNYIQKEAGKNAEVIWGNGTVESLGNKIGITIIATGFEAPDKIEETTLKKEKKKTVYTLDDELPEQKSDNTETENDENKNHDGAINEIRLIKKEKNIKRPLKNEEKPEAPNDEMLFFDKPVVIKNSVTESGQSDYYSEKRKKELDKKSAERIKKLQELSIIGKPDEDINQLENVPAYVRKNVELDPVIPSSESQVAKYILSGDGKENREISNTENSFIHNKAD